MDRRDDRSGGGARTLAGRVAAFFLRAALPSRGARAWGFLAWACACAGTGGRGEEISANAATAEAHPAPQLERLGPKPGLGGEEVCFNGWDDNENGLLEEGCGVEQGSPQFLAAWSVDDADVDLWVADPQGEVAELGRATALGLVKFRECPSDELSCGGHNYENVALPAGHEARGRYWIRLRVERLGSAPPPLEVRLGVKTRGTLRYVARFWQAGTEVSFAVEDEALVAP